MAGALLRRRALGSVVPYASVVALAAPSIWWRLEEAAGTVSADSGSAGKPGSLIGGATFASAGVRIAAPAGYEGLGAGVNLSAASVTDIRASSVSLGGASTLSWTIVLWVAGAAGASQYLLSRSNDMALIYGFVANTVEFFSSGYSGSNPRTGSGISLPAADTTTPTMIVYRYNNGQWAGFRNDTKVFDVARSFALPTSHSTLYLGSDSGPNPGNSRVWDLQTYARALSDAEIFAMYASRGMA